MEVPMGATTFPQASAASKTPTRLSLTSGSSWTVPAGVTSVIATLVGGGGGGGGVFSNQSGHHSGIDGMSGSVITSTVSTTPGASISYAIGAGGNGGFWNGDPQGAGSGGTTTFTGATSASGGNGGGTYVGNNTTSFTASGGTPPVSSLANNGGRANKAYGSTNGTSAAGGTGSIHLEYWL